MGRKPRQKSQATISRTRSPPSIEHLQSIFDQNSGKVGEHWDRRKWHAYLRRSLVRRTCKSYTEIDVARRRSQTRSRFTTEVTNTSRLIGSWSKSKIHVERA